jgi:hypothetical protein
MDSAVCLFDCLPNHMNKIRSLMHDYLATDGESSFRPRLEETEAKRQLYTGQRDKNKVRAMTKTCLFYRSLVLENV